MGMEHNEQSTCYWAINSWLTISTQPDQTEPNLELTFQIFQPSKIQFTQTNQSTINFFWRKNSFTV